MLCQSVKVKVSNYGKWCLKSKSSRKVWQFHFYFLLLSPTYASRPTRLGFWADSVWLRICLYLWKSVYHALFLTSRNLENFKQCQSIAAIDAHVVFINDFMHVTQTYIGLLLCVIDDYINSIAWVLRCLFVIAGYSRTSGYGTGKCQVPRSFIYRFTIIN